MVFNMRPGLLALAVFLFAGSAFAAPAGQNATQEKPLEITAKQTLEWHRNDLKYIARGDVVAKQGDTMIESDTMTADYRADEKSKNGIYQLTATGNVRITGQGSVATGDKAVYDVDKGLATMTGKKLLMTSPGQTVTARDRFEYWANSGKLSAVGNAHAVRKTDTGEDTIDADTLSAIFVENPQTHSRELARMEAEGHVVITTPTEVLHGDRGDYIKASNVAHLYGHVTIKRGPNVLEGDSADVDLNTNISRMHAGPQARVRGVFYPGTQDAAPAPQAQNSATAAQVQPSADKTAATPAEPDWQKSIRPSAVNPPAADTGVRTETPSP
jgi:lipopolysaccharide export system protein LptA